MAFHAVLFDFDGLILDTETLDFQSTAALYRSYGCELSLDRWLLNLGTHGVVDLYADLAALSRQRLDHAQLRRYQRIRYLRACLRQPIQPGVRALIAACRARHIALAVASSSPRRWVAGWLKRHALLDAFACIRSRDDVAHVKPAPDLFLSAAACLGVAPADCVVLEDSPNGMLAAAAAQMRCVAVPLPILDGCPLPPVTMRLRSLAALPPDELLARLADAPRPVL